MQASPARLVLVKEVSSEEEHVDLVLDCELEDLLKGDEAVSPADGISFSVPNVVIRGQQDLQRKRVSERQRGLRERRARARLCTGRDPP